MANVASIVVLAFCLASVTCIVGQSVGGYYGGKGGWWMPVPFGWWSHKSMNVISWWNGLIPVSPLYAYGKQWNYWKHRFDIYKVKFLARRLFSPNHLWECKGAVYWDWWNQPHVLWLQCWPLHW